MGRWIKRTAVISVLVAATCWASVAQAIEACARVQLTASKSYDPITYFDADQTLSRAIGFALPPTVPVSHGHSGDAALTFRYGIGQGKQVSCRYRGDAREAQQQGVTHGAARGTFYRFDHCDSAARAGNTVFADTFTLHVDDGDAITSPTSVRVVIDEKGGQCAPIGSLNLPALDRSVPTTVAAQALQLYTGEHPIQQGVYQGAIDPSRVAIVTGRMVTLDGKPIAQGAVTVADHPEYGITFTRADGTFHMAVNGGGFVVMKLEFGGATVSALHAELARQRLAHLFDVAMVPPSPTSTPIAAEKPVIQVAQGSSVSDEAGVRQATLLFPANNKVQVDGVAFTGSMDIKITELTYGGCAGLEPLPPTSACTYAVDLTVASTTPAVTDLAKRTWTFAKDKPVIMYVENFLKFPFGKSATTGPNPLPAPLGYYDDKPGGKYVWVPAESGVVLNLVWTAGSDHVDIDLNGDGLASTDEAKYAKETLGISDEERKTLLTLYAPIPKKGKSFWRAKIPHLSKWDINWGVAPPADAEPPIASYPRRVRESKPCRAPGSLLECENLTLGQAVAIRGTPFSLHYRSDHAPGWTFDNARDIPVADENLPASVKKIEVVVTTAGQVSKMVDIPVKKPAKGEVLYHHYVWDGKNGDGSFANGEQIAVVQVTYIYPAVYAATSKFGYSVGGGGGTTTALELTGAMPGTRKDLRFTRTSIFPIGRWDATEFGLGGWSLDVHHVYSKAARALYKGNGQRVVASELGKTVTSTLAAYGAAFGPPGPHAVAVGPEGWIYHSVASGSSACSASACVLQSPAGSKTSFPLAKLTKNPEGLAVGLDRSVYVAVPSEHRVVRIVPDPDPTSSAPSEGVIHDFAGKKDVPGTTGDGDQALSARLTSPTHVAVGSDGSVYIVDQNVIRRVAPDGTISRFAGFGLGNGEVNRGWVSPGDGGDATSARVTPRGIAVGGDGVVYITEASDVEDAYTDTTYRVRRIGIDGKINTFAGTGARWTGAPATSGDGGPALSAKLQAPTGIAVGADGAVYVGGVSLTGLITSAHPIRRIGADGIITTVAGAASAIPTETGAGCPPSCGAGDRESALGAYFGGVKGIAIGPAGDFYVADSNGKVRRFTSALPGFGEAAFLIADPSGREVYSFSTEGRHCATYDALTAFISSTASLKAKYSFEYTDYGTATPSAMTCSDSRKNPKLTKITDIDSNVTTIDRNSSGVATSITGPFDEKTTLGTNAAGMLSEIKNANSEATTFTYYPDPSAGLMKTFVDPRKKEHIFDYDLATGLLKTDTDPAKGVVTQGRTATKSGWTATLTRKVDTALSPTTTYTSEDKTDGSSLRSVKVSGTMTTTAQSPDGADVTEFADGTKAERRVSGDPRFGTQAPLRSTTITTPIKGTVLATSIASTVSGMTDPLTFTSLSRTVDVNKGTPTAAQSTATYVPSSRTLTLKSAEGRTRTITFDNQGRVVKRELPSTEIPIVAVSYTYDRGRLKSVTQGTRTVKLTYNDSPTGFGFLDKITNPLLHDTVFTKVDSVGRVKSMKLPNGEVLAIDYDENGNVTAVTPPDRPPHGLARNEVDRVSTYTPPKVAGTLDTPTKYTYYFDRQPHVVTRPDGSVTFDLDSFGRRSTVTHKRGTISGMVGYTYHPTSGHLDTVTTPAVTLKYQYDGELRTDAIWSGEVSGTVHHDFDNRFRIAAQKVGAEPLVPFNYDRDGVPTQAGLLTLTPDPQSGLITATALATATTGAPQITDALKYNGFAEAKTYAASWIAASGARTALFANVYDSPTNPRDAVGRIVVKEETILADTVKLKYHYDEAGRLRTVTDLVTGTVIETYSYSKNGNRASFTDGAGVMTVTDTEYDEQDRIKKYGAATYTHTLNGERATKTVGSDTTQYVYDALGNLLSVTLRVDLPTAKAISYVVDGMNRRVGRKVDGKLTTYLYSDQLRVVASIDSTGDVSRYVYVGGAHAPAYMTRGGKTFRIITDHLGSTRLVVALTDGSVMQRMDYDAFGRVRKDVVATGWESVPFGFAGGLYDRETGLVRFGARDYDAETGRWTAKDRVRFAGGANLYEYAIANPINFIDRSGHVPDMAHRYPGSDWQRFDWGAVAKGIGAGLAAWGSGIHTAAHAAAAGVLAGIHGIALGAAAAIIVSADVHSRPYIPDFADEGGLCRADDADEGDVSDSAPEGYRTVPKDYADQRKEMERREAEDEEWKRAEAARCAALMIHCVQIYGMGPELKECLGDCFGR